MENVRNIEHQDFKNKKKEAISCQNQIVKVQSSSQKTYRQ